MAALLGVPIPYGSVGTVNAELLALSPSSWPAPGCKSDGHPSTADCEVSWMERFAAILQANSWQVQRYLTEYTKAAPTPFPPEQFAKLSALYAAAQQLSGHRPVAGSEKSKGATHARDELEVHLIREINGHRDYLDAAAALARAQWSQFGIKFMVAGLVVIVLSLVAHAAAIARVCLICKLRVEECKLEISRNSSEQISDSTRVSQKKRGRASRIAAPSKRSGSPDLEPPTSRAHDRGAPLGADSSSVDGSEGGEPGRSRQKNLIFWLFPMKRMAAATAIPTGLGLALAVAAPLTLRGRQLTWYRRTIGDQVDSLVLLLAALSSIVAFLAEGFRVNRVGLPKIGTSRRHLASPVESTPEAEHLAALGRGKKSTLPPGGWSWAHADVRTTAAVLLTAIHAFSLLSNSFIMAEGHVARFLLATVAVLYLRNAVHIRSGAWKAVNLLLLNAALAWLGLGTSFKAYGPSSTVHPTPDPDSATAEHSSSSRAASNARVLASLGSAAVTYIPIIALGFFQRRVAPYDKRSNRRGCLWVTAKGSIMVYVMVAAAWATDDLAVALPGSPFEGLSEVNRLLLPRFVYLMSGALLLTAILTAGRLPGREAAAASKISPPLSAAVLAREAIVAVLCALCGPVMVVLGRKSPIVLLLAALEAACLLDLQQAKLGNHTMPLVSAVQRGGVPSEPGEEAEEGGLVEGAHGAAAMEWSLLTVQLFFCTGHRCTFDGLHYTAAFTGFDDFNFVRQGILLAVDTFGASHFLPTLALPLLAFLPCTEAVADAQQQKQLHLARLTKMTLVFGFVRAITTAMTTAFVTLERRHLMVWSLFAPKYVFDSVGLLLIDVLLVLSAAILLLTLHVAGRTLGEKTKAL